MSKNLFNDFDAVSAKQWKQKIQADLKGADYNEALITSTYEGIDIKPFYNREDLEDLETSSFISDWKIGETIKATDITTAHELANEALKGGVEALHFSNLKSHTDLSAILKNLPKTTVYLDVNDNSLITENLDQNIFYNYDPINHLNISGNWHSDMKTDMLLFKKLTTQTKTLTINGSVYQNAGANMVQQLAYLLAQASEYLHVLHEDISDDKKQKVEIIFEVAIGSHYFFEIAKLRALKQLWNTLAIEFEFNATCRIHAVPSKRNKTIYDYNTNMLRTTTECMSAVLGGADTVFNLPYDNLYHQPNAFGNRIARNQLLILRHESYFDKVKNAADGSYYIETLTTQLAEKALTLFKQIEASGGYLKQLKEGLIQKKIEESARKEQEDFNTKKLVLLGTNKHPNLEDKMKNNIEKNPFLEIKKRKTLIKPIIQKRLSENMEINRLEKE